ncbi:MAG: polysaccharide export protein [Bryobacterales bacterium]|nr:polysaccharide export protein [Bryobacterales bacterium]
MTIGNMHATHLLLLVLTGSSLLAQLPVASIPSAVTDTIRGTYILGPDDQVTIRALEAEEISEKPMHIDAGGFISVPMIGRVFAGGLTAEQLEASIARKLSHYLTHPEVAVSITEYRSQPVSVIGEVNNAGIVQLRGSKSLIEVLSLAGGLKADAGHWIEITRHIEWGRIPLANARDDATAKFSVARVSYQAIVNSLSPVENILICPNDVISVPRGNLVYVAGQVRKSGGFLLREKESLSVLQALSLAEGPAPTAALSNARILRGGTGTPSRTEIPVDVKKIYDGRKPDIPMQAEDILFIPNSTSRAIGLRTMDAVIQIGTGVAVYRR